MAQGAGENRFRLPNGINRNVHKSYSTGWTSDSSPWVVASRIAAQLNMQLLYSCDGYLTLRHLPQHPNLTATGAAITSAPQTDFDATSVFNTVRVTGTLAPPKKKKTTKKAKADQQQPTTKITAVATAAPNHPLSPQRLGRNGVPRYLPDLIDGSTYKSMAQARALAVTTLAQSLPLTTGVSFDMVPVFHLDSGDLIQAQTDAGRVVVRLETASIPIGSSGDMSVGVQRRVSRGPKHYRVHTARKVIKPKHHAKAHHHTKGN